MKTLIRLLSVSLIAFSSVGAADHLLPPKDLRAEWNELRAQKFSDWTIKSFLGWDIAGDGGSRGYFFESDGGERFDLVVANPAYWTAQDRQEHRQVFFVVHKNRFYRIESKSAEERNIIEKLVNAAARLTGRGKKDPILLTSLAKRLESREPVFKPKTNHSLLPIASAAGAGPDRSVSGAPAAEEL